MAELARGTRREDDVDFFGRPRSGCMRDSCFEPPASRRPLTAAVTQPARAPDPRGEEDRRPDSFGSKADGNPQHAGCPEGHEQSQAEIKVKSRPVEVDTKVKSSEPADAAALIAEALKRKFAHRYRHDSGQEDKEDKEDFKLPIPDMKPRTETPLFGQHMLKPTGKRKLL
ncbi:mitochondrial fission regulator 1 [Lates japonicus]|uniref:Mitochondrial fission regulator 1 n=1 Tax=Lates japonicus TaxID=270547 RepID=A0AAD3R4J5_LATJO|nr:mitochondrial fission regulator 1 [Lates japonicus]